MEVTLSGVAGVWIGWRNVVAERKAGHEVAHHVVLLSSFQVFAVFLAWEVQELGLVKLD